MKTIQEKIQQSKFNEAIADCQSKLKENPEEDKLELLYLLAIAFRYNGNINKAIATTNEIIKLSPNHARARQERGYCYLFKEQFEHAIIAFAEAVKINPALIASWQNLQKLYSSDRNLKNTKATDLKYTTNQLDYLKSLPEPLLAVSELFYDGKYLKAEDLCRHFLKDNKHNIDGMRLLAEIGIELKVYDDAEFLLESCVEFAPGDIRSRAQYLNILTRLGKFRKALSQAYVLLTTDPKNISYSISQGIALVGIGELDKGILIFNEILAKEHNRPGVHVELGHALKSKGDFEKAVKSYQTAYKIQPTLGDAYWSLANTKTYRFTDEEISNIRQMLETSELSETDRAQLNFAIAKAYEDRKSYGDAFDYYYRGNEIKRKQTGYSSDVTEIQVDQQIKYCTRELFKNKANLGAMAKDPIFIVGLPRSGSTLLEQILASHSKVDGTMELQNILGLAMRLRGRASRNNRDEESRYPKNLADIDESYFRRFGDQFIKQTKVYRQEAPFFIDKMPNNFMHIGLIRLILPNAKIIDARREPMACCFSGFKQLFGEGQDFTYGLKEIGSYYNSYVKVMEHWDSVLPGFVLRVQHEDVLDDLEKQVRRILDFCGLDFEESCLEFYKTKRNIKTPSSEQVRQPIYKTAMQQWQHFDKHLRPLKAELGID